MAKLSVLLVDDNANEVRLVRRIFRGHPLVTVDFVSNYAALGTTEESLVQAASKYDLLVLDILMGDDDPEPFVRFVNAVAGQKPFIAFTMLKDHKELSLPGNQIEVREFVFSRGGIGVITKSFNQFGPDKDPEYCIVQAILEFYWYTR